MQSLKTKEINFIAAGKRKEKKRENKKTGKIIMIAAPVILFAGVVIAVFYLYTGTRVYEQGTAMELALMNDPAIAEKKQKADELTAEIARLTREKSIIDQTNEQLDSMTEIDRAAIEAVLSCRGEDVTITDISYDGGVVTVSGHGLDYSIPAKFAQRLESTRSFAFIVYNGYALESEDAYGFTIQASLNEMEAADNE